ncbi:family 43 glycosylhydrolase [Dinghuibacter silviterrae]|uniref:family 43 glycosylhydrolase n=1 Tax=Dinghuibacter silviterrae TaxID=1539049 RepID=UPI001B879EC2|nr:family 43 glycosylhydrolase [Dinghuibacter silviterrae]
MALLSLSFSLADAQSTAGLYRNPIIYADYSDPDAVRYGNDYYLTASSFNCVPGLPILHSTDLVHWTLIGHALPRLVPEDRYARPLHGNGVWAPAIRYHDGWFYIYYPDPDLGIFMVKTRNPSGAWSAPVCVLPGKGRIDPCPLWDDDGRVYLVFAWAASRAGFNSVLTIATLGSDGARALDTGRLVYDGHGVNPTIEGPKLYKRNGYYYIFAPAGGVKTGWQVVLRSRSIYGPYAAKIVMDQGRTGVNGPHQGAWVETPAGASWFLHFQDKGPYGRILHLQPMRWVDDWPVIGVDPGGKGRGEPVTYYPLPMAAPNVAGASPAITGAVPAATGLAPAESDEFNGHRLGLQWQWEANPQPGWSALGNGRLRLFAAGPDTGNLWTAPNLLLQKFPAPDFTVTTKMRLSAAAHKDRGPGVLQAGLLVMGSDYSYLAIEKSGGGYRVVHRTCFHADKGAQEEDNAVLAIHSDSIYLRVEVRAPDALCRFSCSTDGVIFTELGPVFYAQPGRWIGAKVGLFCRGGAGKSAGDGGVTVAHADIDWFRVTRPAFDPSAALNDCIQKLAADTVAFHPGDGVPRSMDTVKNAWRLVPIQDWTSGFFPGMLWYAYEYTADPAWRTTAERFNDLQTPLAFRKPRDHDLGFQLYTSFGKGYRLTGDTTYRRILLSAADSLATLFNPKIGTILSWPDMRARMGWPHNTIIDNMINLELLFWAARNGGDRRLYDIAVTHAETTMRNHFRPDYSAYHVVVYDTVTGKKIKGVTHQGYADESMWARGQAWAIYGFTMVYRETHDRRFLDFAQKVADVYLRRLPPDHIPYWDFDDPSIPNAPRDASAAAVAASGLLELARHTGITRYKTEAVAMLEALSASPYRSSDANPAVLSHSTGNKPGGGEVDVPIIYADYYYMEALMRLLKEETPASAGLPQGRGTAAPDFSPLARQVRTWLDSGFYPGAGLIVAQNDQILYRKFWGNVTPATEVHVASAGKWLAAATIAAVVDEGKLSWNDKVVKWLPEFTDGKGQATLRQLLSHTAGYPDYQPAGRHRDDYQTLAEAVAHIKDLPEDTLPGTVFHYGGLAMQVAGRMAELATGKDWETLFQEKIARPLGMTGTHFTPVDTTGGHNPMIGGGARGTLDDYAHFLDMIAHDGVYHGARILSVAALQAMEADQVGGAAVRPGEFVRNRHDIYGLGEWREEIDASGHATHLSSPSWAGAYPWVDKTYHAYGFFLARVDVDQANKRGFSAFYSSRVLAGLVRSVLGE